MIAFGSVVTGIGVPGAFFFTLGSILVVSFLGASVLAGSWVVCVGTGLISTTGAATAVTVVTGIGGSAGLVGGMVAGAGLGAGAFLT